ncbi:hypothetical protein DEO72_LG1g3185 [Vigna unguiculata]|uniref:Uncharacterized protein n=1 Tax=Vigna unguiculata TaxID=3917 RepID=A0A4D6KSL5_VIGUN|nr:hypothetical protein DEO72_LG1g3185 [Vigna unguiculata]
MSSASDSVSLSSSSSGSEHSRGDGSSRSDSGSGGQTVCVGRIPMETVTEIREDPLEELAESNWPTEIGYEWVAEDVRTQHSLFKWSRLLKSWLNCIPILERNVSRDVVALERPSPQSFLYFYDTRPKSPTTWLSLISRPGISRLDAFTQSFKHFKDDFFKVVVKEPGRSYFYTDDGNTKFPFNWTDNPWRYKDMKREELSMADEEVVDTLLKFNDKMATKGLVSVYNSIHPIVDIEGWEEKLESLSSSSQGEGGKGHWLLGILKFPTCKIPWWKFMYTGRPRGKQRCPLSRAGVRT